MPDGGECFIDHQVQVLLACTYGQFTLNAMLACGARDHLDQHYSYWNKENGPGACWSSLSMSMAKAAFPWNPGEGQILNPRNRLRRMKAPMNFTTPSAGASELPADLLPVTISLLLTAIDKPFPNRGCSELSIAFESDHGEPRIRIAAITDSDGRIILEQRRILDRRFESSPRLGDLLETAAELHLDEHFPEWCDGAGSTGTLLFTIRREPDGAIGVHPRGIAWRTSPAS